MKKILGFIFVTLFSNSAFATNICDTSCNLSITFPDGGAITAAEPLAFSFGDNALIDTGASSTAYVLGNTLTLELNQTINFDAGGSFDLGVGGNMDFSHILINTNGVVRIESVGGTGEISLGAIEITGDGDLVIIGSDVNMIGSFYIAGTIAIISNGNAISPTQCETSESSGSTISSGTISISSGISNDIEDSVQVSCILSTSVNLDTLTLNDVSSPNVSLAKSKGGGAMNIVLLFFIFLTVLCHRQLSRFD